MRMMYFVHMYMYVRLLKLRQISGLWNNILYLWLDLLIKYHITLDIEI